MCSISGVLLPKEKERWATKIAIDAFQSTVIAAEDRGRDSFGIVGVGSNSDSIVRKFLGRPSKTAHAFDDLEDMDLSFILNNNRAEPTTEYVAEKSLNDVQPFVYDGWIVAHNGTIANDKKLAQMYCMNLDTTIDSAVIPQLLESHLGSEFHPPSIIEIIRDELIGSYALAIGHTAHPGKILLVTNYKPLYVSYNSLHKFFIFTSLDTYLADVTPTEKLMSPWKTTQVPAYSAMLLSHEGIKEYPLLETKPNKKALVVCSGGLDSTVVAAKAIEEGYDVTLLHFRYSCRAETSEVKAINAIGKRLGVPVLFVDTDVFKSVIGGSRLTGTLETVATGKEGAEFAHEWVPARNLIMLSIATGIAESQGFDTLMLGNNLEESGAYPDNEMEFINKLNSVLPYATQVNKRVQIAMPVGNLMKHEIVKLGLEIGAPLDLCWSCYEAGDVHCGDCGPCFMRKTAFQINHKEDMIPYANTTHLCDNCVQEVPTCAVDADTIKYGTGLGDDNAVSCGGFRHK